MKKSKLLILLLIFSHFIMGYTIEDKNISVKVGKVDAPVYKVDVTWDAMEFTYTETINYVWDKTNFTYELDESVYKWNTSSNSVKIDNKSPMPINIELKYLGEKENVKGTFDIEKEKIKSNKSIVSKLTLTGELSSQNTDYIQTGVIQLEIS